MAEGRLRPIDVSLILLLVMVNCLNQAVTRFYQGERNRDFATARLRTALQLQSLRDFYQFHWIVFGNPFSVSSSSLIACKRSRRRLRVFLSAAV
jgi:hypothetical protein